MSADYTLYTLEGSFACLILAISYKLYRLRCSSSSKCCQDSIMIQTFNPGSDVELGHSNNSGGVS